MSKQGRPDEFEALQKRLKRLEWSVESDRSEARRLRVGNAVLVAGAVALFVSLALPWMRGPRRNHAGFDAPATLGSEDLPLRLEARGVMTGWEVLGAAITEGRAVLAVFVVVLVLLALVAYALDSDREGLYTAVQACALLPTLLFLPTWPRDPESSVVMGPGPLVVFVAGVMILYGASRSKP
ncbi:hypothetical protein [Nocardiopsis alkaliphila]|uniref:hypothetical protein n=1 Tax=Nocardiopsis alkaliphila TaxID=225762 RepID=UPI000346233A|nr:hypothetical protein [Nocardiopsis alkaliphila]